MPQNKELLRNGSKQIHKLTPINENGDIHGTVEYYRDEQPLRIYKSVEFENGKRHGKYQVFNSDDSLRIEETYNQGLLEERKYYADRKHLVWQKQYKNGEIVFSKDYSDLKKVGDTFYLHFDYFEDTDEYYEVAKEEIQSIVYDPSEKDYIYSNEKGHTLETIYESDRWSTMSKDKDTFRKLTEKLGYEADIKDIKSAELLESGIDWDNWSEWVAEDNTKYWRIESVLYAKIGHFLDDYYDNNTDDEDLSSIVSDIKLYAKATGNNTLGKVLDYNGESVHEMTDELGETLDNIREYFSYSSMANRPKISFKSFMKATNEDTGYRAVFKFTGGDNIYVSPVFKTEEMAEKYNNDMVKIFGMDSQYDMGYESKFTAPSKEVENGNYVYVEIPVDAKLLDHDAINITHNILKLAELGKISEEASAELATRITNVCMAQDNYYTDSNYLSELAPKIKNFIYEFDEINSLIEDKMYEYEISTLEKGNPVYEVLKEADTNRESLVEYVQENMLFENQIEEWVGYLRSETLKDELGLSKTELKAVIDDAKKLHVEKKVLNGDWKGSAQFLLDNGMEVYGLDISDTDKVQLSKQYIEVSKQDNNEENTQNQKETKISKNR